ncbi:MAG TPA: hypothetical protein VK992_02170 [Candidatus Caenarcaniphilales bacterium]|nr:hypothetical protein [Candidatus Caenarcaniphilales bacterium]
MLLGAVLLVLGGTMLAANRPLARFLHQREGARRHRFGGELRARAITALTGGAFALVGILVLTGVLDG